MSRQDERNVTHSYEILAKKPSLVSDSACFRQLWMFFFFSLRGGG